MPVFLNAKYAGAERRVGLMWPRVNLPIESAKPSSEAIHIGLVNNMADAALAATAHQFLTLLDAASGEMQVNLSLYTLPGVARTLSGQRHADSFYTSVDTVWNDDSAQRPGSLIPDALIVTGREPIMADLRQEPYWDCFTKLLEWAAANTLSAVWSCLAAHAAILHMDDIRRIKSEHKHFGIFACERQMQHPLNAGASANSMVPHSRWNGISADHLTAAGYDVLTRTKDGGVDTFLKQGKSLSVFFQGHPEYESDTLLREYRRDVGRYLKGESETYPLLPENYFDASTAEALEALQANALANRSDKLLHDVSAILKKTRIRNSWHSSATLTYRNWLNYIRAQKQLSL